jgi:hypothetical protein
VGFFREKTTHQLASRLLSRVAEHDGWALSRAFGATLPPWLGRWTMRGGKRVVEGQVNRIKTVKRQLYGRATLPALKQHVLLSAA